ncbi:cholesterol 24-hydroxylase-like [Corticium candelabrum]|uniref:cholesterol 24-hydroxylase-like n=1 Tax=Corticium candelabrum TaxID=121492 RepID=UPI002E26A379|nr:cholesterol 24-hydroxylase-like [Corticium candelabrum]
MVVFTIIGVVTAALVATVAVLALLLASRRRQYSHIPFPPLDNFWLGHASSVDRKMRGGLAFDEIMMEYSKKHGEVFVLFFLHSPYVVVSLDDPKAMREVVNDKSLVKSDIFLAMRSLYGHRFLGNFMDSETDVNVWLKRQKAFAPVYSTKNVRDLVVLVNQLVDKFIMHIDKEKDKEEALGMKDTIRLITSAIGGSITFGVDIETIVEMKSLDQALETAFALYRDMVFDPLTRYLPIYRGKWQQAKETCAFLRGEVAKYVVKRQKETSETNSHDWKDFLSCALKVIGEYDFEVVIDMLLEIYIGTALTTPVTMSNCLREILRHPEVEKQVVEEVDRVLEGKPFVSATDIQSLHYLDCVLKETLRRHSTVPVFSRASTSALTVAGYAIPVGCEVHISCFAMHLSDKLWQDPMKFDPNRFYSLNDPSATLSFGCGIRACLGRSLAEHEMTVIIARLFQTFTFQLEQQSKEYDMYEPKASLIIFKDPVKCKIKRRLVKETGLC